MKSLAIPAVAFFLHIFIQIAFAAPPNNVCDLPQDLQREVATKYPGAKVVGLSELEEDDRKFFQKDHGDACPGLVKVDFYGDGKPTLALVLTKTGGAKEHTELVVAHRVEERWIMTDLDAGDPSPYAPAVWSQPPGEYHDIYGNKTIRATRPVIVFCKYESWAILYAWTGNRVTKIWLSD
ncbi:MAG: hypothetical protein WA175_10250 [Candidatus Acidiferrales bacterium]